MHKKPIDFLHHHHSYNTDKKVTEARTLVVVVITVLAMIVEITVGWLSNSMALLADGWHMGTHAFALGIALLAYVAARKYAHDTRFNFGTWKIEVLGGYTSAIVLGFAGILMIAASVERLRNPLAIQYNDALIVACVGLAVNLICAVILGSGGKDHDHDHPHHGHHSHDDLNLRAAFLHVIADALTSVFAILALCGAKYLGAPWLDPLMGIVGAGLIIRWSVVLLKDSGSILLERESPGELVAAIKTALESDGDTKVADLHVFRVAQHKYACVVTVLSHAPFTTEDYRSRLKTIPALVHVTIETNRCCAEGQGLRDTDAGLVRREKV